jgi:PGF-CTERM protein
MKSMTKLMIVAMILAAALVVAPAAARSVSNGDTIYVGEDDLDVDALFGSPASGSGTLVWYSSVSSANSATVGKTIAVADVSDFDLTSAAVGSSTGAWYAFTGAPFTDPTAAAGTVLVETPSVGLDVLQGTGTTSVDGKAVTRGQSIRFEIQHNVGTLPSGDADVEIRVTTPAGGTVTTFEGVPLNVDLSGTQKADTGLVALSNATTGTYTAQGVWKSGSALYDKGYSTNSVTFEVTTGSLAVTANKDTVIRNNAFTVTVTGESSKAYYLNVTTTVGAGSTTPMIVPGQIGVYQILNPTTFANEAIINTTAGGTRTVEFNTTTSTDAKTYTIEVKELAPGDKSDEVKVKVEAGAVTVTASGTGTYYIGEEITLSGTNTDNNDVYIFMTGPNLDRDGVNPKNVTDTTPYQVDVEADDTWSFKWNTADTTRNIDAGSYTIYAVSKNVNKDKLSDAKYDTVSVSLRSGFISATTSGATVARGDDLTLSGTAQGNPDNVFIWVFGKNYYGSLGGGLDVLSPSVESDGTFEEDIDTTDLAAGQYFVVVQHPMGVTTGNAGSITWTTAGWISGSGINMVQLTGLQAPAAAAALINALDSPNIPDTYVKLTFVVDEPQLFIDPIGDKAAGSTFTITGTTNLAVGETLNVEVTSAAFQPGQKTEGSTFSGAGGSAIIQQGDGMNTWSFEVDGTSFNVDQYIITVESIDTGTVATAVFNVIEGQPTTQPTGEVTETPTETETTTTTTTTATPTQSPGFGALLALAGLGAVAFLVLRRD